MPDAPTEVLRESTPTRVCPHCATVSETGGEFCPHCGKPFAKGPRLSRRGSRQVQPRNAKTAPTALANTAAGPARVTAGSKNGSNESLRRPLRTCPRGNKKRPDARSDENAKEEGCQRSTVWEWETAA